MFLFSFSSVSEVKLSQIKNWIYFRKPLLVDIFKRLTFSRRHEDFVSGSHKKRGKLQGRTHLYLILWPHEVEPWFHSWYR